MKNLPEKAMLTNLTIRQWCARKHDKKISHEIEREHNAHNAGKFNKILIAEVELKEIQKIASSARTFLYLNTLPWGDNGDRLLPAINYLDFVKEFRSFKSDYVIAVDKFIMQYPYLKDEAKLRLNGMFDEEDYPSTLKVKDKFDMDITFMPIADSNDFRLKVDQDEVDNLKDKIELEIHNRITEATKNIWTRIKDAVGHMVEKLSIQDAVFRDSLVTNIEELINVLPRLNFTEDVEIKEVIENMKGLMVSPDVLRKDSRVRIEKAEEAKAILDKINDFMG